MIIGSRTPASSTMRRPSALTSPVFSCSSNMPSWCPPRCGHQYEPDWLNTQPKRSGQCSPAYSAESPPKLCPATTVRSARSLKGAIAFTWGNNSCCTASQKSALHGSSWARCVVSIASINTYTAGGSCRRWVSEVSAGQTGILCAQNSPSSKTASGRSSAVASPVVKIHTRREFFNRSLFQIISLAGVSGACGQSHPGCRGACGISSAETACPRPPFQLCGFSGSAIAWGNSFRQPSRNSRRSGDGAEKMSSRSVGIKQ